jgi:hypothetical protein
MTLQDLVVSQPLAQRMKNLGWEQDTIFSWTYHKKASCPNKGYVIHTCDIEYDDRIDFEYLSAPTFAEVWGKLLDVLYNKELTMNKFKNLSHIGYDTMEFKLDRNPAEAAGELWVWLQDTP